MRLHGNSNRHVAQVLEVSERHASTIWQRYLREGNSVIPSQKRGRQTGQHKKIGIKHEKRVLEMTLQKPSILGMDGVMWTRTLLQQAIKRHLKINMSIRTVGGLLKLWGMDPKRPIVLNSETNSPEIKKWIYSDYKLIVDRGLQEGAAICWCVEKPIRGCNAEDSWQLHNHLQGSALLASISNQGQIRFVLHNSKITSKLFLGFLSDLVNEASRKVILLMKPIMAIYHDKNTALWLEENKAKIEVVYLPAYI